MLFKPATERFCTIQPFAGHPTTPVMLGTGGLGATTLRHSRCPDHGFGALPGTRGLGPETWGPGSGDPGPGDLAHILSTDCSIHVLDPTKGKIVNAFPEIAGWEGPADWQYAHPALVVNGGTAYVTESATSTVHAVDLATGHILASKKLDVLPNDLAVTVGAH